MRLRLLSLSSLVALAACSGSSAPPPPVARASASPSADELRPLSSRDGDRTPADDAAGAAAPSLPPGHPPIGGDPHGGLDPHGNAPAGQPGRSAGSVSGTITVAATLRADASGVLYVVAKRAGATVAARRVEEPRFPFAFEISGADAMTPGAGFEGPLDVIARLSKSGDAIPSPGDLEGVAQGVKVPSRGVTITIDTRRQ